MSPPWPLHVTLVLATQSGHRDLGTSLGRDVVARCVDLRKAALTEWVSLVQP